MRICQFTDRFTANLESAIDCAYVVAMTKPDLSALTKPLLRGHFHQAAFLLP